VLLDDQNRAMEIIVPDDQLSLAIGRRGQNVRLASQLTGWKLDINSESRVKEMREFATESFMNRSVADTELTKIVPGLKPTAFIVAYVLIVGDGVPKMQRTSGFAAFSATTCCARLGAVTSKPCFEMTFDFFAPRPAIRPFT